MQPSTTTESQRSLNSQSIESNGIRTFPVDVEHMGIRIVIPIVIIVSGVGLYAWLNTAWPDLLINSFGVTDDAISGISAIIIAIGGALGIGAIADRLLKRFWPSGRSLMLDPAAITLTNLKDQSVVTLHRDKRLNVRSWRFTVRRNSPRAPRGWYMVACQFMQDEAELTVYSFLPPRKFEGLPLARTCLELQTPPERATDFNPRSTPLRGRMEQRVLSELETGRLLTGAELRPVDFSVFVNTLAGEVSGWSD